VSIMPILPMGASRRAARPGHMTAWRRAKAAARCAGLLLAAGFIAVAAIPLLAMGIGTLVISPVAGLGLPFLAVMTWLVRPLARPSGAGYA
jgi:hypothetical protein